MLPVYEQNNVAYKDQNGVTQSDVLQFFGNNGWNAERVRLFVDPYSGVTHDATGVYQTLDYVKALGKRIKEHGQSFMLDFHYSDTWTDPGKHALPKSWEGLTAEQLKTKIYDYTKDCLQQLVAAGATPDYIQPGNEITTGMLWPTGGINGHGDNSWDNFAAYLEQAIKACKEICPNAKIVLHTEMHNTSLVTSFYRTIKNNYPNISYDVIGLSYYPEYHGTVSTLEGVIRTLEAVYSDKEIMIVETGHGIQWHIPSGNDSGYELTEAGQKQFATDLITMLNKHPKVTGLYWWYPEDNGNGVKYNDEWISWWNAALFNHDTGKPYAAFYELIKFRGVDPTGIQTITTQHPTPNTQHWYTLSGQRISKPTQQGIYIHNGNKVVIK
jgi:arabinogalactan endo-1,4-beta-galactosidase